MCFGVYHIALKCTLHTISRIQKEIWQNIPFFVKSMKSSLLVNHPCIVQFYSDPAKIWHINTCWQHIEVVKIKCLKYQSNPYIPKKSKLTDISSRTL